jgi:hypothetical protein
MRMGICVHRVRRRVCQFYIRTLKDVKVQWAWVLLSLYQNMVLRLIVGGEYCWQPHRHLWADCQENVGSSISQPYRPPRPATQSGSLFPVCRWRSYLTENTLMGLHGLLRGQLYIFISRCSMHPHRKHTYRPARPDTATVLLFYI